MSRVRISIIGTSNGINSKGYAAALSRHQGAEIVCNASLGSSHSSLIGSQMPLIAADPGDICVLDLCVNEQRASNARQYDFAETWRALDYFAERCTALNMLPLVLLLPQAHPEKGFQTATVDLWRTECMARGLPYLDVQALACQMNPDAPVSLWADPSHPDIPLSTRIAAQIVLARDRIARAPHSLEQVEVHSYRRLNNLSRLRVERRNSRFEQEFWEIPANAGSSVSAGQPATIVGLGLNAAHTNGTVRIEGDTTTEKHLDNILFGPSRPMWHVVWNVLSPVSSQDGHFRLQNVPVGPAAATERSDHFRPPGPSADVPLSDRKVELASVICRTAPLKAELRRYHALPPLHGEQS